MAKFLASNLNYQNTTPGVLLLPISSTYATLLGVLTRSSADKGFFIEEIFLGGTGGADVTYDFSFATDFGTPTTLPEPITLGCPSINPTASVTLFGNNTTEPPITTDSSVFNITTGGPYRYVFPSGGLPVAPGSSKVGYVLRAQSASYTGTVAVSIIYSQD